MCMTSMGPVRNVHSIVVSEELSPTEVAAHVRTCLYVDMVAFWSPVAQQADPTWHRLLTATATVDGYRRLIAFARLDSYSHLVHVHNLSVHAGLGEYDASRVVCLMLLKAMSITFPVGGQVLACGKVRNLPQSSRCCKRSREGEVPQRR